MDITKELTKRRAYTPIFERLKEKARETPHMRHRAPCSNTISLQWVLQNERKIVSYIIGCVKKREVITKKAHRNEVMLDKLRVIYSQAWPAKILHATTARLIEQHIAPSYSSRLFSFRKGYGSHSAINNFREYLTQTFLKHDAVYIIKDDVQQYDKSIDLDILTAQFREYLQPQQQYLWDLLESFQKPEIAGVEVTEELPMGYHITPIAENLYLSSLDSAMEAEEGLFYLRYGDDLILAHTDPKALFRASKRSEEITSDLGLTLHPDKREQCVLLQEGGVNVLSEEFSVQKEVEYLGITIDSSSRLFLPKKKLEQLKSEIKRCTKISHASSKRYTKDRQKQLQSVIKSINVLYSAQPIHPYLSLLINLPVAEKRLKNLDVWIARQILKSIYRTGQNRVFRYCSLKKLRQMGLRSLVHERRLSMRNTKNG